MTKTEKHYSGVKKRYPSPRVESSAYLSANMEGKFAANLSVSRKVFRDILNGHYDSFSREVSVDLIGTNGQKIGNFLIRVQVFAQGRA